MPSIQWIKLNATPELLSGLKLWTVKVEFGVKYTADEIAGRQSFAVNIVLYGSDLGEARTRPANIAQVPTHLPLHLNLTTDPLFVFPQTPFIPLGTLTRHATILAEGGEPEYSYSAKVPSLLLNEDPGRGTVTVIPNPQGGFVEHHWDNPDEIIARVVLSRLSVVQGFSEPKSIMAEPDPITVHVGP